MHLVTGIERTRQNSFYTTKRELTRPNTLPYTFKQLRIHRNLTKSALSEKISYTERYINEVENGSRFPSLPYCLACAAIFNANPNWVKNKWAKQAIQRYSCRLLKRLQLWPYWREP